MVSEVQGARGDIMKGNYGVQLTARLTPDPSPFPPTHLMFQELFKLQRIWRI